VAYFSAGARLPRRKKLDRVAKEWDEQTGNYYYGARYYDPKVSVWLSVDPLASERPSLTPYNFMSNNPVMRIDPTGMLDDWVERDGAIVWDENVTSANDADLQAGDKYLGKAVAVFKGSRSESLGKGENINGEGAETAKVTLYGPDGADDVTELEGFTMTSNSESFTPIDDGYYTATRREYTGSGALPKQYQMFEGGENNIRTLDGVLNSNVPSQVRSNGEGYKTDIFIHRTNNSGWAGGRVSTGCLLLSPSSMRTFDNKLKPLGNGTPFSVIVNRK
jgi:RHS repeat-associated protein